MHTWLPKKKEFITLKERDFLLQITGHELTIYYKSQHQSSVYKVEIEESVIETFQMIRFTNLSTAEAALF